MENITTNGQSAAKSLSDLSYEERSTTSAEHVDSSESKRDTSIILVDEDIVWTLNESLKKFNKKYNYIYKTTNLINKKYYIGRHSTNNIKDNYLGSGKILKNSIKKYGKDNFKSEILYFCKSFEDLVKLEINIVNNNLINDLNSMNIIKGGLNPIMIGENNPNYNKTISTEQKKILSDFAKTRTGNKNPFYNKNHTKETIEKLKNSKCIGKYYTPNGVFNTAIEAGKANNCSKITILRRCVRNVDKIITGNRTPEEFKSINKTWRDFGFYFIKFNNE